MFGDRPGHVTAESSSGGIAVGGLDGSADLEASSGNIRVDFARLSEDSSVRTSSGDVTVRVPGGSSFDVDLETSSGRINVDFPLTMQGAMGEDRVQGYVGSGGPALSVRTSSGNMRINRR
jgi:DUF4097 and DUF4098 domain-containing protein YvlB